MAIMDKPFYQEQIENMLSNTEYYNKIIIWTNMQPLS